MGEMSVEQIVSRCQQGDEQAFGLLYTVMHDRLRRICRRYTTDEQTVDDLLHDAFLLILSKMGTLKDCRKAEAWMTTVTRNLAQTWLNRQRQDPTVSLDALEQPLQAAASTPSTAITYDEILHLVDALPRSYRRVFRLSVLEGLSHQEIAALLGIEPHTSSAQLSRAKLLLRRWLRPMVLLLVAALLPLGWLWLQRSNVGIEPSQTVTDSRDVKDSPCKFVTLDAKERPCKSGTSVAKESPCESVESVAKESPRKSVTSVAQESARKSVESVAKDSPHESVTSVAQESPHKSVTSVAINSPVAAPRESRWTIDLAYSGLGTTPDAQLPYATADTNPAVYDSVARHHMPLTVALTLSRGLSPHWQVGLGLQYTRMTTDREWGNTYARLVSHQRVQYLGLPLFVEWHQPLARRLSLYTAANVTLQLPLRSTVESHYELNGSSQQGPSTPVESTTERLHPGTQWSVGLGLGLQYNVTPTVGFFVEPRLQHYFQNSRGVETWQTEHPAALSVPFGLRITF